MYEELIKDLRYCSNIKCVDCSRDGDYDCIDILKDNAADALEEMNRKVKQLTEERNAAVEDLRFQHDCDQCKNKEDET